MNTCPSCIQFLLLYILPFEWLQTCQTFPLKHHQHTTAMEYITLCGTKPQRTLFLKKQDPTNVFLNQSSLINHSNGVFKQLYYIKLRCIGSAISVKTANFRHCNFIRLILIHSNYTNIDYLLNKIVYCYQLVNKLQMFILCFVVSIHMNEKVPQLCNILISDFLSVNGWHKSHTTWHGTAWPQEHLQYKNWEWMHKAQRNFKGELM